MNDPTVLDTSALLALLLSEQGAEKVAGAVTGAMMSTVNVSEALATLLRHGYGDRQAVILLEGVGIVNVDFTTSDAREAARLQAITRSRGLSLGDRACIALALREGAKLLTADRAWVRLELDVEIEMIR